jgi:glycosyltransferase involved in cell wall biosynthesis
VNHPPRVALFADSFHEVNGVALTCRSLEDFARRNQYPMLSVHAGLRDTRSEADGITRLELSSSRLGFSLEQDLSFDLLFARHLGPLIRAMHAFQPDIVHITGPSHLGILGALLAHRHRVPLVASWHTNVHQYAGRRLPAFAPQALRRLAESTSLRLALRFYQLAGQILAPNRELVRMLSEGTARPCHLMRRGVDCEAFHPGLRQRHDDALVVGYVGRLSPEKSVRRFAELERHLSAAGLRNFRIEIVGQGSEQAWLRGNITRLRHHGVLRGPALARAYANFDIFAFPSETDTYGNVVQEAMASGVPCVVMDSGGPASIVRDACDGLVAETAQDFLEHVLLLAEDRELRSLIGRNARRSALGASWDAVFRGVYEIYLLAAGQPVHARRLEKPPFAARPVELEDRAL